MSLSDRRIYKIPCKEAFFQEEHLLWRSRFMGAPRRGEGVLERPKPDPCTHSQYRLDFEIFSQIFPRLLPWQINPLFTVRAFRVR
uniref:Uncharacterized protein n=1 Tax=Parascaris equorum TaxID=6256 RepID=A0A914R619_PAREQ